MNPEARYTPPTRDRLRKLILRHSVDDAVVAIEVSISQAFEAGREQGKAKAESLGQPVTRNL